MPTHFIRNALRLAPSLLLLALSAAMSTASSPEEAVLELNPATTRINFSLRSLAHTVHGTFALKSGSIRVDPGTGSANGLVIVDAASGDSGNRSRDAEMKESVLEAQRFPEIRFAPQHIEIRSGLQGESRVKIRGAFWLHGVEHDLTLDALVRQTGEEWTATAHFVIPYVKWGLKDPSVFILRVSDTVEIDVNATGHVAWTPAIETMNNGAAKPTTLGSH